MPIQKCNDLDFSNLIEKRIFFNTTSVYLHEGYLVECFKMIAHKKVYLHSCDKIFFELGFIKEAERYQKIRNEKSFFEFEVNHVTGNLIEADLDNYISQLYVKETLEITQCYYLKAKFFKSVTKAEIKKLVISNPYTKGLIKMMEAFVEENLEIKNDLFLEAIQNLFHIRYYHTEAIYFYCIFLQKIESPQFNEWLVKGIDLSKKHSFNYLLHLFMNIREIIMPVYNQNIIECEISLETINQYIDEYEKM